MLSETNMNRNLNEANKRERQREIKTMPAGHNLSPNNLSAATLSICARI